MEKKLILAIVSSLLVLFIWQAFVSKTYHIENKAVVKQESSQPQPVSARGNATVAASIPFIPKPAQEKIISASTANFVLDFDESQAAVKDVIFKAYRSHQVSIKCGFGLEDQGLVFSNKLLTDKEAVFVASNKDREVSKRFIFDNSNYSIYLEITILNKSNNNLRTTLALIPAILNFSSQGRQPNYQDFSVSLNNEVLHPNPHKTSNWDNIQFMGWRERYFCGIIEPVSNSYSLIADKISSSETGLTLRSPDLLLAPGEKIVQKFRIYLGPQDLSIINKAKPDWSAVIYYGKLDFIAKTLLKLLSLAHHLVRNWGVAIILFSIIIYLVLYPLTLKQMHSMKAMQALQPHIDKIRASYKDNPQRLNKEIMELYRTHNVNPFGGCLPMILQIPIFFALYQVLMRSVALKGASFLWIQDLSEPDKLAVLSHKLPFIGNEINILPILMAISMFAQQKLSSKNMNSAAAEQQKLMLIVFPIMFGFIFYRMPSGLVLYWFVNSSLMLTQQLLVNRAK